MLWIFQELLQDVTSFQVFLVLLIPAGYLLWKYQKRREEKLYETLCRRERITRRIMEN